MRKTLVLILVILTTTTAKSQDISGKDFWYTFPQNNTDNQYLLIINSEFCASGTVTFPSWGVPFGTTPYSASFTVAPGTATQVVIPVTIPGTPAATVYQTTVNTVGNNGFHIVSDSTINVVAVIYDQATVDGEDVLPTTSLGTTYVVNSRSYGGLDGARFTVGATQNGTNIQIKNSDTGGTTNITLNAGETYMVLSTTNNCTSEKNVNRTITSCNRLTASTVTSTSGQPIYVIGHTICSNMLWCGACDGMMAEFLPTSAWGGTAANPYVTAQAVNRNALNSTTNAASCLDLPPLNVSTMADFIEITGPTGTVVTVNNVSGNTVLPALGNIGGTGYGYAWYQNPPGGTETNGRANTVITATNPIQIVQYSQGYQTDASVFTDPEAILVYPKSTWVNSYIFSTSTQLTSLSTSIAIIVQNTGAPAPIGTFTLDGTAIPATGWSTIGTGGATGYRYKIVNVAAGQVHCIRSTSGYNFGFYVNNIGTAESYTTQGGSFTSSCTFHACNVLPIGLFSFNGTHENNSNLLKWVTKSENQNDYFIVERSNDGINFQNIGTVKGSGNSSSEKNYSYVDPNITTQEYYYRLSQVDFDGRSSKSELINIKPGVDKSFFWSANYSEDSKSINLMFNPHKQDKVKVELFDLMGRKVMIREVAKDQKEIDLDVIKVPSGVYLLNFVMGEQQVSTKILIH